MLEYIKACSLNIFIALIFGFIPWTLLTKLISIRFNIPFDSIYIIVGIFYLIFIFLLTLFIFWEE